MSINNFYEKANILFFFEFPLEPREPTVSLVLHSNLVFFLVGPVLPKDTFWLSLDVSAACRPGLQESPGGTVCEPRPRFLVVQRELIVVKMLSTFSPERHAK